jgi:hypothetical protein
MYSLISSSWVCTIPIETELFEFRKFIVFDREFAGLHLKWNGHHYGTIKGLINIPQLKLTVIWCIHADFRCTQWAKHRHFGHARDISFRHPIKFYFGLSSQHHWHLLWRIAQTLHCIIVVPRNVVLFYFPCCYLSRCSSDTGRSEIPENE